MDRDECLKLLEGVRDGRVSPAEMLARLGSAPFDGYRDLGYAAVDHHRGIRQGAGEVIYGRGKTAERIAGIVREMARAGDGDIIITGLSAEKAGALADLPGFTYYPEARIGSAARTGREPAGHVVVVSGGTSDMPVAEEAAVTAELLGSRVTRVYDVGVAGLHRLLARLDTLLSARAVVAVAGMEGALASVVGGLVSCPVVAVPTSVGYGANFGGLSALLSMLNSCASGVTVVNIDNGFGAGYTANMINRIGLI